MKNQAFSKIWIVIIAIILLAGGILAWQYFGVQKEEVKEPEKVVKDETANWKTYRNERQGYEIKYPSDLLQQSKFSCQIPLREGGIIVYKIDDQAIRFSHNFPFEWYDDKGDFHSTLTDFSVQICVVEGNYEELASYYFGGLENPIVIAKHRGFKIDMGARGRGAEVYYLEKEKSPESTLVIEFFYTYPEFYQGLETEEEFIPFEKQKEIFSQMLSTFRFLE